MSIRVVIQRPIILTAVARSEEEAERMLDHFLSAHSFHETADLYVSSGVVDLSGS